MLGWSVVQDVTGVILAAIVIVALRGESESLVSALIGFAAFAAVAIVTALALPRILRQVRQQPDLFLLLSVGSGLVIAGIGAVVFGAIVETISGRGLGTTDAVTALTAIPGVAIGLAVVWAIGVRSEQAA